MKIRVPKRKKKFNSYEKKLAEEMANNPLVGQPGTVTVVNISHDSWCNHFNGGECNCNPDMDYQPVVGEEGE